MKCSLGCAIIADFFLCPLPDLIILWDLKRIKILALTWPFHSSQSLPFFFKLTFSGITGMFLVIVILHGAPLAYIYR